MTEPEKMALTSMDIAEEKREELKRCLGSAFPEVFAEGAIDFEQLRRVLGDWVEPGKERFGLSWPGKAECMKIIQQPSVAALKPVREESVNFDETENLFIEGDNLEVLKLLQKAYFGKVKMIYIDPPYNTGNEFIYPDKYSETLETYLAYTGQIDSEGKRFSTTTESTGRFHSRWLTMMYPRLYLARNLMRQDGAIFISIDDNECSNLRSLCDSIFGEENFIAQMVWEGAFKNDARQIGTNHEYIIVYAKDRSELSSSWLVKKEAAEAVLKEVQRLMDLHGEDHEAASEELAGWFRANKAKPCYAHRRFRYIDKYGAYKEDDPTAPGGRKFDLINPRTNEVIPLRKNRGWSFDQETFNQLVDAGKISFVSPTSIMVRRYFHETDKVTPQSVFYQPARSASERLAKLLGEGLFDFPKDETVVQQLIEMATGEDDGIVLDFFAGSATTGHSVMKENAENGRHLQYVMVQLPEPCSVGSTAALSGYKTISDIGKERIRRAAKKIAEDRDGQLDLEGNGKRDFGFKVYKLDRSNFKTWQGDADTFDESGKQLEMHVEHLSTESSAEDVLYELLLKAGFPLTTKVKTIEMAGKQVFSIEDGALLICLEKEVTPELIDALADVEPLQVICLDAAFKGNDQLKANAVQTFKARAQAEESEIVFKTV